MADIAGITLNEDEITYGDLTLADIRKQLDHIDTMLHDLQRDMADVKGFIDDHRPALTRALRFLDNPVTRFKKAQAARSET